MTLAEFRQSDRATTNGETHSDDRLAEKCSWARTLGLCRSFFVNSQSSAKVRDKIHAEDLTAKAKLV